MSAQEFYVEELVPSGPMPVSTPGRVYLIQFKTDGDDSPGGRFRRDPQGFLRQALLLPEDAVIQHISLNLNAEISPSRAMATMLAWVIVGVVTERRGEGYVELPLEECFTLSYKHPSEE